MSRLLNSLILVVTTLLATVTAIIAYFGHSDYETLSESLYGQDAKLMDSVFLEYTVTPTFAFSLLLAVTLLLGKEWHVRSIKKRMATNLVGLIVIAGLLGCMLYTLNAPALSAAGSSA